ncbi:mucin-22-like [Bolinopsis microptera]|uniref:mucin-22-like n=1 Tax=Bolinopsis microptera TaxID=2820187 RepID=UPI00307A4A45
MYMSICSDQPIMKITTIILTALLCLPIQGDILPAVDNEITPVSVSMSSTHSSSYVATKGIDKDTNTLAHTSTEHDPWFKAKLGKTYCVEEVHHYIYHDYHTYNKHACSRDACTCISGHYCTHFPTWWPVSVYSEDGTVPDNVPSDSVESVNTEVKKGSYATISCIITDITERATVTWRTSTGPVSGDKLVPTQGSNSDGTQTSTLAVDGTLVNEDTAYTCRVTSGSLPDSNFSDTTVNLNVYDVESVNTEVKKGSYATISCIITGITETAAVTWRTSTGPVPGDKLVPTKGSNSGGTQTSTLAVDGTLVNEDTAYTCRVTSGSLPDSNFSDTIVNLNVYDVESVNTEMKKGSYATISCIITGITETAAVTWRTSTGPVPAEKFTTVQGSNSAGTQTSTLAVDGTLVNEDTAYTCRVTSGSLPDSNSSDTTANLNVYDVESVNTEMKKGSYATISCIITGITETAAVTWRTSTGPVPAEKFTTVQGRHSAGTQTSTLAVDGTLVNEDTAYTCRVTLRSLPDFNFSDTTVNLNVYDVESVNTDVKKGSYATISCIITGITETAAVTWRTSTGPVPGDKLVPTQGSNSDGTHASTLAVDGTLVNEDTAYTCRVTSGSLPDSKFSDTTVNLNVYDVESVNTEVKKGSYATISCIITGITETATVTWRIGRGPVPAEKFTPVQGSHSAGTQTSTLAVDGTLVNEYTTYTCRVTSGSLPDSIFYDTSVNLNVYDVESVNTEVKKGSYATISCIITGITETATVTWQTNTGPVPAEKFIPVQGSNSAGTQTSTLAVDGTLVNEDTAYTCRVTSGSLPDSNFSDTTVNLNVYDVESVNTEVKKGSYTTISCIITGIRETAAVTWRTSTGPVPAEKFTPVQGSNSAGTQTSTLAVDGTLINEDTAYTCRVTSGSLPDSNFSDTTVNLNVYDVESVNTEVKKGSYASISCIITGITETAAVTWRTSTGPVSAENFTPVQGSNFAGTQTSTLAVDGTLVNEDTAYTCKVTSGSLPDSNFSDTTVNLNVYDVESVNTEVKKGSYATISCIITGIRETAAVTWRTSTGPVSAEKFTPVQGSNSAGTQTSTLAVDGTLVNKDTAYTCRVTSGSLPDSNFSDTTVNLNVYDVESVNTEVKKGSYTTISCIITGITQTAAVTWRTSTGPVPAEKFTPVQGSNSAGTQTSTLAVDGTLVNEDTAYTCRVTSGSLPDSNFSDTTVNLNVYDVESVNTEVKKGSYATISCIITGITETATVTWRTSTGPVPAEKFTSVQGSNSAGTQTSTLAVDGTLVNEDTAYTCRVTSGSLPDSNFSDTTVNLNVYDVESVNTEVKEGSYATISCIITSITETAAVTWRTSTGPVRAENFTSVQGSNSAGTQTSTLAVDGTLVNEDTAYTCRVTSGSLPDSNFSDTTVNLNVYDVESVNTEVKKGSYTTISCIITGIKETAAVTWRTSTGPVPAENFTSIQGSNSAGTQTSTLAVDGTLVNEDTAYTCRVTSGSLPDSNFSDTTVNLNVYDVESVNTEVKKGSYATISCIITGITETAAVTWRTSTGPVPAEKFTSVQGSNSAGTQTSTLAVDGTLVNKDTAYTCRVTSGSLPDSNFSDTTVNLNVYDVESVNTEVKEGSYATISCIITSITETAAVTWRTSTGPVRAENFTSVQGSNSAGTQTSTLAVDGTLVNEDTAYTCRVTSGSLPDSNFSDTTVNLNVYDVESVNTEVKKGSYTTISCIITGIKETAAVTWRTSTGPVPAENFTSIQGSNSAGTQTSTLAVDGTLVNEDTAYTCRVTSGSLPDSNFSDTTVNLNVYDVESVNTEVKKGSYATISCIITSITETAAVTWRTSTGPVRAENFTSVQGSNSAGTQTSTLAVDGTLVNEDTAYTCRVTSGSLPDSNFSDTTVNLNVYDVESVNTEVKKGSYTTISCIITGITETAAVTWRTSTGPVPAEKFTPVQGSNSAGTQTSTLAVDGTLVNEDTAYTCRVTSGSLPDSNFTDTTVNLNVYDVESVNTEVKKGSYATISCIITGITETATVTWRTSTGPVPAEKLTPVQGSNSAGTQTSTLAVDGTLVNEDTAYTCRVTSGSLPDSNFSDTTVNLNVYDVESVNTEVKKGSYATISCIITGITETAAVTWRTSTGPVPVEKFVPIQGSNSAGTQTSTLAVDGTFVNEDTAYTCRVTSGSLPDSNFSDTIVNLNVYDVEPVNKEVKKGSSTSISCVITGIIDAATVTWRTSTGPVPGEKFTPVQGSYSAGTQTSTLAVDGTLVNEDTAYTCRVTSGSLPNSSHSDTTVTLNVYETRKETLQNSTTTTILRLDPPNEVASYTCIVFAHGQEYNFYSEVEIETDGLALTPEQEIRAFNGATVNLKSSYFFSSFAEGHFWWKHNDSLCLTKTCSWGLEILLHRNIEQ